MRPFSLLLATSLALEVLAFGQVVSPVLTERVEPEYTDLKPGWLIDPARVDIVVGENGTPFSLHSTSPLPDNVVQSLAKWRFKPGTNSGKPASFRLSFNVPVRRSPATYLNMAGRPSSFRPTGRDTAIPAEKITEELALKLVQNLKPGAPGLDQSLELLAYALKRDDAGATALRSQIIGWLVANEPGASALASHTALVFPAAQGSPDSETYQSIKDLWLKHLAKDPTNAILLGHATWFLQFSDAERAERLLAGATDNVGGAAAWLGELYAYAALGVTYIDPRTGAIRLPKELPAAGFGAHARESVESTKDPRVLLSAFTTIATASSHRSPGTPLPSGFLDLCGKLEARVTAVNPENTARCTQEQATTGVTVTPARLTFQQPPVYPLLAKKQGVQGSVHFSATIGTNGKIADLELLSAPLVLYESARNAVTNWEYKPSLLAGKPITVSTQIDVHYRWGKER